MDYHNDPKAMCRVLVQYIASPKRIQSEVMSHFNSAPSLNDIADMQAAYQRSGDKRSRKFDASVVWMDERNRNDMAAASMDLLQAIEAARVAA